MTRRRGRLARVALCCSDSFDLRARQVRGGDARVCERGPAPLAGQGAPHRAGHTAPPPHPSRPSAPGPRKPRLRNAEASLVKRSPTPRQGCIDAAREQAKAVSTQPVSTQPRLYRRSQCRHSQGCIDAASVDTALAVSTQPVSTQPWLYRRSQEGGQACSDTGCAPAVVSKEAPGGLHHRPGGPPGHAQRAGRACVHSL